MQTSSPSTWSRIKLDPMGSNLKGTAGSHPVRKSPLNARSHHQRHCQVSAPSSGPFFGYFLHRKPSAPSTPSHLQPQHPHHHTLQGLSCPWKPFSVLKAHSVPSPPTLTGRGGSHPLPHQQYSSHLTALVCHPPTPA